MKKYIYTLIFLLTANTYAQTEISTGELNSLLATKSSGLIIVEFYASWCGICKGMEPTYKKLSNKYGDKINFYKVNNEDGEVDFGIKSYPTYLFLKNNKVKNHLTGEKTFTNFESNINEFLTLNSSTQEMFSDNCSCNREDMRIFARKELLTYDDFVGISENEFTSFDAYFPVIDKSNGAYSVVARGIDINGEYRQVVISIKKGKDGCCELAFSTTPGYLLISGQGIEDLDSPDSFYKENDLGNFDNNFKAINSADNDAAMLNTLKELLTHKDFKGIAPNDRKLKFVADFPTRIHGGGDYNVVFRATDNNGDRRYGIYSFRINMKNRCEILKKTELGYL